jgi:hypothetical protein
MFRIGIILVFVIALFSCRPEKFFKGSTNLQFSEWDKYKLDTLTFDTVFTLEPGTNNPISVTKKFWVKNNEKTTVSASFSILSGTSSPFRFSINGRQGPSISDIEIPAGDSVWGFVQCSLKPNNQTMPALVLDSIIATVGGGQSKMFLEAYGWDAHYFRSMELPCGGIWNDKVKPYVIVNSALVPLGCTFTIKEGVSVYNSPRSALFVQGTLKIEGSAAQRVTFTGSRPRFDTRTLPNQWGGIHIQRNSTGNKIQFANINNAAIGIRVDSLPASGQYNLELENTQIKYSGQAGLLGVSANIKATNCEITEAGSYTFLGLLGGNYDFNHCTFATYVSYTTRSQGSWALTNTLRDDNGIILRTLGLTCNLQNSIVFGSLEEELELDNSTQNAFTFSGDANFIKSKTRPLNRNSNFYEVNPKFVSTFNSNYQLDSLSPAQNKAIVSFPSITNDILGNVRTNSPDIGAYERKD